MNTIDCRVVRLPSSKEPRKGDVILKVKESPFFPSPVGTIDLCRVENVNQHGCWQAQHLYFTREQNVRVNDWLNYHGVIFKATLVDVDELREVIHASTDSSLGLPAIPESFIQKYVASNGKIDRVKLMTELYCRSLKVVGEDAGLCSVCKPDERYTRCGRLKLTANSEVAVVDEDFLDKKDEQADKFLKKVGLPDNYGPEYSVHPPKDKELEDAAKKDWNEGDYTRTQYKGQEKARHTRIFRAGWKAREATGRVWTDKDMKKSFGAGMGYGVNGSLNKPFDEWIDEYKEK